MRRNVARNPEILSAKLRRDQVDQAECAWLDDVAASWGRVGWSGTEELEVAEDTVTFDELVDRLRSADLGTAPLPKSLMLETVRSVL
jgi:hypothetical protein